MVVGQLENRLHAFTTRNALLVLVGKEVKREITTIVRVDEIHAEDVLVEGERDFRVLDAEHHTVQITKRWSETSETSVTGEGGKGESLLVEAVVAVSALAGSRRCDEVEIDRYDRNRSEEGEKVVKSVSQTACSDDLLSPSSPVRRSTRVENDTHRASC